MKKIQISIVLNIFIVILVCVGLYIMFNGIQFIEGPKALDVSGLSMLKFFTVDSNILIGIASLLVLIKQIKIAFKIEKRLSVPLMVFKEISVVGVAVTFFITLFYLAPFSKYGFTSMYLNANLFFHLIIPLLSMINYIFFEKYKNSLDYKWWGIMTVLIYSLYYIGNIIAHLNAPDVTLYDFYGFTGGNFNNIIIVLPLMYGLSVLISTILIKLNIKFSK